MTLRLEKLDTKIERLIHKREAIQKSYIGAVSKLVSDTVQKGIDIQVLAGLVLDAEEIIEAIPSKVEAWQTAGRKFLSRSGRKKAAQNTTAPHTI